MYSISDVSLPTLYNLLFAITTIIIMLPVRVSAITAFGLTVTVAFISSMSCPAAPPVPITIFIITPLISATQIAWVCMTSLNCRNLNSHFVVKLSNGVLCLSQDPPKIINSVLGNQGYSLTCCSSSCSSTDSVKIYQRILRDGIVYNMTYGRNINTSCGNICCYKDIFVALLESIHRVVPLPLREIPMYCYGFESLLLQFRSKSMCSLLCCSKDNCLFLVSHPDKVT